MKESLLLLTLLIQEIIMGNHYFFWTFDSHRTSCGSLNRWEITKALIRLFEWLSENLAIEFLVLHQKASCFCQGLSHFSKTCLLDWKNKRIDAHPFFHCSLGKLWVVFSCLFWQIGCLLFDRPHLHLEILLNYFSFPNRAGTTAEKNDSCL